MNRFIIPAVAAFVLFISGRVLVADGTAPQPTGKKPPELNAIFAEFDAATTDELLDKACRAHPYEVVIVVDRKLEGWLAEQEKPEKERAANPDLMMTQALRIAEHGDRVFNVTAYSRYAKAWQRWTPEERTQFRADQAMLQAGATAWSGKHLDEAEKDFTKSLEFATALGDLWGMGVAEQKLGDLAFGKDDYTSAEAHMKKSLEIFTDLRHVGMLRSLRGLAALYEKQGKYKEALEQLERMVKVATEAGRDETATQVHADIERLTHEAAVEVLNQSSEATERDKQHAAIGEMKAWKVAVTLYLMNNAKLPDSLETLRLPDPKNDGEAYVSKEPSDPWDNAYVYNKLDATKFEIICYGADKKPGGDGVNADLSSNSLSKN